MQHFLWLAISSTEQDAKTQKIKHRADNPNSLITDKEHQVFPFGTISTVLIPLVFFSSLTLSITDDAELAGTMLVLPLAKHNLVFADRVQTHRD